MPIHWPSKDPAESNVGYDLDWSGDLNAGDTISASTWVIVGNPTSLTIASPVFAPTMTKVFVSGGREDQTYVFQNSITTKAGENYSRTTSLLVKAK